MPSDKFRSIFVFLSKPAAHLVIIAVVGVILYSNTLDAPFQWDERIFIERNPIIKDLGYFLEPSRAEDLELYTTIRNRYIGFLTFALNYRMGGLDVTGYHIVNISIHIINSLLVYLLVILTFRTPFFGAYRSALFAGGKGPVNDNAFAMSSMIAFFTALVFVSHPLQTEAVTYIFQRLASLVTMFYLVSLIMYIKSRMSKTPGPNGLSRLSGPVLWYSGSVLFAVLAMKTKENAFTLPLMIAIYELSFFDGPKWKRLLRLVPMLSTLLIIPLTMTGIDRPAGEIIGSMAEVSRGDADVPRLDYLFTQFRVIMTYIRLLFLPINQNIDYAYPVFHTFFDKQVILSFLFIVSVLVFAASLFYRSRSANHPLRLIAFGIFWFFMTISVESSIIPIPMIISEYRVHLPSVGAFMGITTAAVLLLERTRNRKVRIFAVSSALLVVAVFSYAAYARNGVWEDEISLWEDVVKKSPGNARAHNNLGLIFFNKGLIEKAIKQYGLALKLKPDYVDAYNNLGIAYRADGSTDKAIEQYLRALSFDPSSSYAHNNLGNAYRSKGLHDKALEQYEIALRLAPGFAEAHYNIGIIYLEKGLKDNARMELETALKINPDYKKARSLLSSISGPDSRAGM